MTEMIRIDLTVQEAAALEAGPATLREFKLHREWAKAHDAALDSAIVKLRKALENAKAPAETGA